MNPNLTIVSADEAVRVVKSGDHVHLSSVASAPQCLIKALARGATGANSAMSISTTCIPKDRLRMPIRSTKVFFNRHSFSWEGTCGGRPRRGMRIIFRFF